MEYEKKNTYKGVNLEMPRIVTRQEDSYLRNSILVRNLSQETYLRSKDIKPNNQMPSLLEELANTATNVDKKTQKAYALDNCHCPPCGCLKANLALILSPAGVATAVTIFAASSAM